MALLKRNTKSLQKQDNAAPKREMSALDAYTNRVYKIIVLMIPGFCMCASATIVTLHFLGWYPDITFAAMWAFVFMDFIFLAIGIYFIRTGFDEDGIVYPDKLHAAKYTMAVIYIIQWNTISYIWPFTDFWAYCLLFTIVYAFFFDVRLVAFETAGITVSMLLSWFIKGGMLLPRRDEYFSANMTFRVVGVVLMLLCINIITYFGGKFLVQELEKYVNYDTLTHLLNRRTMDNYLKAAHKQAQTGQTTFCLMMMDIDDFKKVNDTYGHDCGDEVLKYVAHTVTTGVKKNDNVFRWGGEEILVLLNTDYEKTMAAAERIRKDIARDPVDYRGDVKVPVTITIGVSPYVAGATIQQMMDDADAKLYYGKRHGKNQVVGKLPDDAQEDGEKKAVNIKDKDSASAAGQAIG